MNATVGVTLNFDASTVAPSKPLDPIPSGWYKAVIEETKLEPTSKPGGQMLSLVLKVIEGEFAGRKLFDRLNLVNENPQAVQIAYETLSAIGHATGVVQCQNSQQYHNIPLAVKVKLNAAEVGKDGKNYDARNEVKGYDHVNSDHQFGPAAGAPAIVGGVAGAPAGVPVWAAGAPAAAAAPPAATLAPPQAAAVPTPQYAPPVAAFQPPAAAQPWADPNAVAAPAPAAIPAQPFAAPAAAPVQTGPVALPGAGGIPYDSYRQQGWTDQMLHEHGKFSFPAPAAPVAPVAPAAPAMAPPPPAAAPAAPAPAAPAAGGPPPWATPQ